MGDKITRSNTVVFHAPANHTRDQVQGFATIIDTNTTSTFPPPHTSSSYAQPFMADPWAEHPGLMDQANSNLKGECDDPRQQLQALQDRFDLLKVAHAQPLASIQAPVHRQLASTSDENAPVEKLVRHQTLSSNEELRLAERPVVKKQASTDDKNEQPPNEEPESVKEQAANRPALINTTNASTEELRPAERPVEREPASMGDENEPGGQQTDLAARPKEGLESFGKQLESIGEQLESIHKKLSSSEDKLHSTEDKLRSTEDKLRSTEEDLASTKKQLDVMKIESEKARFDEAKANKTIADLKREIERLKFVLPAQGYHEAAVTFTGMNEIVKKRLHVPDRVKYLVDGTHEMHPLHRGIRYARYFGLKALQMPEGDEKEARLNEFLNPATGEPTGQYFKGIGFQMTKILK